MVDWLKSESVKEGAKTRFRGAATTLHPGSGRYTVDRFRLFLRTAQTRTALRMKPRTKLATK